MTTYHHLDWKSLNAIKNHLYRRLASPINNALGRLAIARHIEKAPETEIQLIYAERNLERAMNLIRAWAALIHVKSGGSIAPEQRRRVQADDWPEWLIDYLHAQTGLQLDHTATVYVHPETFFESVLLLWRTGAAIGSLKQIVTQNAPDETKSIWLRAIFEPPPTGPYTSLGALAESLSTQLQYDTLIQIMVLQDLFTINNSTLKIQNNKQTGEQALAVCLPAVPAGLPPDSNEADDLFTSVIERLPPPDTVPDAGHEHESFFAQVIRELNGDLANLDELLAENDTQPIEITLESVPDPADSGESETLVVPPPSLRERLNAVEQITNEARQTQRDQEANARYAAGLYGPEKNNTNNNHQHQADTLIVPPPGFRERIEAVTKTKHDIELVHPDDETETQIVPPPEIERRFNERRVKRDTQSAKAVKKSDAPDSSEPES
ncbi:MAG: hypothetical protein JXA10_02475, partial [Anaerolineae bacterium]|nr:hypothetical protein [Anaerolineae bacterium]